MVIMCLYYAGVPNKRILLYMIIIYTSNIINWIFSEKVYHPTIIILKVK